MGDALSDVRSILLTPKNKMPQNEIKMSKRRVKIHRFKTFSLITILFKDHEILARPLRQLHRRDTLACDCKRSAVRENIERQGLGAEASWPA
jgi:hypothetical protein